VSRGNCLANTATSPTLGSMTGIGFGQADMAPYASPDHWNELRHAVVGCGLGPLNLREEPADANEQYLRTSACLACLMLRLG